MQAPTAAAPGLSGHGSQARELRLSRGGARA